MTIKEIRKAIDELKKSVKDKILILSKEKSFRQIAIELDVHHEEIRKALSGKSYRTEKYIDLAEKLKIK